MSAAPRQPGAPKAWLAWGLLLGATLAAGLSAPQPATDGGLATVHVRVILANVWVSSAVPAGVDWGPEAAKDWILDARINATDGAGAYWCHAETRSMHSRFLEPAALDFVLRFSPARADCLHASYTAIVFGYGHTSLKLIDFDGTSDTGRAATIDFRLTAPPARGSVNGTADGEPLDLDGGFDYEVRVVESSLPLPPEAEVGQPARWLVRVRLQGLELLNPATRMGNDWFLDAEARPLDPTKLACAAQLRSMHARFFTPRSIDLVVLDLAGCEGEPFELRLVPWLHLDDGLLDMNGDAPTDLCPGVPFPGGEAARFCEARLQFTLTDGLVLRNLLADGSRDKIPLDLEYDIVLRYSVEVVREPPSAALRLFVDYAFTGLNYLHRLRILDNWNLDVQAVGQGDCVAQHRNSHGHYVPFRHVDLTFYGPDAARCMALPVRLDFAAYWTMDNPFDIDPRRLEQGGLPCPDVPPLHEVVYVRAVHVPVDEVLAGGCRGSITWDPAGGPAWGWLDGVDDGFADVTDARLTWALWEV